MALKRYRAGQIALPGLLLALLMMGGCARQAPGTNGNASGRRLRVSMTFVGNVNPNYYYYFLINLADVNDNPASTTGNYAGNINAPYPIPVLGPVSGQTYGNGFATSSATDQKGFTDFVLFSQNAPYALRVAPQQGFAIYHVIQNTTGGSDNPANFISTGVPVVHSVSGSTISFDIDLAQLVVDSKGQALSDPIEAAADANAIQYLQINIIATNIAPTDNQTSVLKQFDSMGNDSDGRGQHLSMTLSTAFYSDTQTGPSEPTGDVYPPNANVDSTPLDLTSWSIAVIPSNQQ